ncbi:MAG: TatD family hydrolase [Planctomycetota bacterium]|nr:TatD family hydrolase [Planctomycetota bacterium]MCX8039733.1 TatD family hydrolase [Planctomycetota bacterium]MDW8373241.1 TatD family hydrolase [Planctomycetota bacterium]
MFDSHCHLTAARFDADRDAVVARMQAAGVRGCLSIGTGAADARAARALSQRYRGLVWAAAGLDPFTLAQCADQEAALQELAALLDAGGFVALGECGIEYHHPLLPPAAQAERFRAQAELARARGLPLIVHARSGRHGGDAHQAAQAVVRAVGGLRGVIHSFDGDWAQARAWLDLGFHVAINGMVTYRGRDALRAAVQRLPADRLLLETDAPYLAPEPERGRRCEMAHAARTAEAIAELRGERVADVGAWAGRNAELLFGIRLGDR